MADTRKADIPRIDRCVGRLGQGGFEPRPGSSILKKAIMVNMDFFRRLHGYLGTAMRALRLLVGLTLSGITSVAVLIGIVALYERCPEAHALLFGLSGIVAFVWITAILAKRRDHVEGDEP